MLRIAERPEGTETGDATTNNSYTLSFHTSITHSSSWEDDEPVANSQPTVLYVPSGRAND